MLNSCRIFSIIVFLVAMHFSSTTKNASPHIFHIFLGFLVGPAGLPGHRTSTVHCTSAFDFFLDS